MAESWIKEDKKEEKLEEKKREPITNYNELKFAFERLSDQYKYQISKVTELVEPLVYELNGDISRPDETGSIGRLRVMLRNSRIKDIPIGQVTWSILKNVEDLNGWQNKYVMDLETFFKDMKYISESAFVIIDMLYKQNYEMMQKLQQLGQPIPQVQQIQEGGRYAKKDEEEEPEEEGS